MSKNIHTAYSMETIFLSGNNVWGRALVELIGIEPTTYSLQSYRSPN
jgi:hypothetical protein